MAISLQSNSDLEIALCGLMGLEARDLTQVDIHIKAGAMVSYDAKGIAILSDHKAVRRRSRPPWYTGDMWRDMYR